MLPINAPRHRQRIVEKLAAGRLPHELIIAVFQYVVCDLALPVVVEITPQNCYSNTEALSKHLLGTPGAGAHRLLAIMEEALLSERDILLDYRTASIDDQPERALNTSQLSKIRHVELQVSIDPLCCYRGWAREAAASQVRKQIRRTLKHAHIQLPSLQTFRLTIHMSHWGSAPHSTAFHKLREKEEPVISNLLSTLEPRIKGYKCTIQLQHFFRTDNILAEESALKFQAPASLTLRRIKQRTAAAHTRSWLLSRFLRLSGCLARPTNVRNELIKLSIQNTSSPKISHSRWHFFVDEDAEVSMYYDAFTTAVITSPFYLNGCPSRRPRLRRNEAEEIEARFQAAGGVVAPCRLSENFLSGGSHVDCSDYSVRLAKMAVFALTRDL